MESAKAPQQVIEAVNNAANILVTVSRDPSVDALSAALGLALVLDKADKHVSAVFSGVVPPAIAFLEPEKIFDDTTDSLRDFIIALNKEKADHLRYKLDGDLVKIFITPYRSTITQNDLTFTQGDFNVDLVIALGVDNQEHLDRALEGHGQILHDATILTVTAGTQRSSLGGIDWHDDGASGLSELAVGIANALTVDGGSSLDTDSATALLTGIVAQTDRFSNEKTTSRVMAIASQLMEAGADQQLVATQLEQSSEISTSLSVEQGDASSPTLSIDHDQTNDNQAALPQPVDNAAPPTGSSQIASAYALDDADQLAAPQTQAAAVPEPAPALAAPPVAPVEPAPQAEPTGSALTPESAKRDYIEPLTPQEKAAEASLSDALGGNLVPAPGSVPVNQSPIPSPMLNPAYALDNQEAQPAAPSAIPSPSELGLPMPPPVFETTSAASLPPAAAAPPPLAPPVNPPAAATDPGQFKIPGS